MSTRSFGVALRSRGGGSGTPGDFEYVGPELPEIDAVIPVLDRNDPGCRVRARVLAIDADAGAPITAHELYRVRVLQP